MPSTQFAGFDPISNNFLALYCQFPPICVQSFVVELGVIACNKNLWWRGGHMQDASKLRDGEIGERPVSKTKTNGSKCFLRLVSLRQMLSILWFDVPSRKTKDPMHERHILL